MKIFNTIDSTNIYANKLVNEGLSVHGEVILAYHQTQGKGQREKTWQDTTGESVLMTVIMQEGLDKMSIFEGNKLVALSVAEAIAAISGNAEVKIKWPNDIFLNERKVCGILVENGYKGARWSHAVIGIGINVLQADMHQLPDATSLFLETGVSQDIELVAQAVADTLLHNIDHYDVSQKEKYTQDYDGYLYKINEWVEIEVVKTASIHSLKFVAVDDWGRAVFEQTDGSRVTHGHGTIKWIL